jgi:uncharacterized membrane protein YidH (DUF202 family)
MNNISEGTNSVSQELKGLRILTTALSAGVVIFTLVSVGINQFNGPFLQEEIKKVSSFLLPLMTGLALLALLMARYLYQQRIRDIREGNDHLKGKMDKYRAAVTLYLAICEGMALFSVVLFLLSGDFLLLVITGAMLLLMLGRLYAIKGVAAELNLSWQEQEELK